MKRIAFAAATAVWWKPIHHVANGVAHTTTQQSRVNQSLLFVIITERVLNMCIQVMPFLLASMKS